MQAATQAFVRPGAGVFPAFARLRGYCFLTFFCAASATASLTTADQEISFIDLERLVETCVEQTDFNIENQPALPIGTENTKFSEVHLTDAGRFEETTRLRNAESFIELIFKPDTSERYRQETLNAVKGILQHEPSRKQHQKRVLRQIGAHDVWKSPNSGDGEWNNFGIVGGSAWWYSQDVAVVWRGLSYVHPGTVCQIYGVPSRAARHLVEDSNRNFARESQGPIARYVATEKAIAPLLRALLKSTTGIGKKQSLPSARIEVIEIEPGFLTEDGSSEWVIVVSDSRYHDLL